MLRIPTVCRNTFTCAQSSIRKKLRDPLCKCKYFLLKTCKRVCKRTWRLPKVFRKFIVRISFSSCRQVFTSTAQQCNNWCQCQDLWLTVHVQPSIRRKFKLSMLASTKCRTALFLQLCCQSTFDKLLLYLLFFSNTPTICTYGGN